MIGKESMNHSNFYTRSSKYILWVQKKQYFHVTDYNFDHVIKETEIGLAINSKEMSNTK